MSRFFSLFVSLVILLTAGCAGGNGMFGEAEAEPAASERREPVATYDREQVGQVQEKQRATVVSLEPVDIEEQGLETGTILGAVAGGLAGRQVGSGTGRDIMTVVGAVAGGYAGSEIESRMDERTAQAEGVAVGLELDNGRDITVVEELEEDERFRVGERVTVVFEGDDQAHIEH